MNKILIVDDERSLGVALNSILEEAGYDLRLAENVDASISQAGKPTVRRGEHPPETVQGILSHIARDRRNVRQQELTAKVLAILNRADDIHRLIGDITCLIKDEMGFEAVGIRIREGEDYPYFETNGFSDGFVEAERHLCPRTESGECDRDEHGNVVLECMCGNVIQGRTDPSEQFFTEHGSFWTNCTTELLASTTEQERRSRTRNRCNAEGYESVALIPLAARAETVGLLQINDRRRDVFSADLICFLEGLSTAIGVALKRQQDAAALQQWKEFNRSLIENSPDCIKTLDLDGRLLFMSAGGQRCLEIDDVEAYLNRDWTEFWEGPNRDAAVAAIAAAKATGAGRFVGYCPTAGGTPKWWDVAISPILDADNEPRQLLAVSRDVTEQHLAEQLRRSMEAQLRQAQKLEAIGTLASGVAHEINNPIMVIMGLAQVIMQRLSGKDETLNDFASRVIHETERVATIVKNLLGFARRDEEQPPNMERPIDIVQSTVSLMSTVLRHDQIALDIDVPDDLPRIKCRSQQLQQVIINLLTNARDALNTRYPELDPNKIVRVSASEVGLKDLVPPGVGKTESACGSLPSARYLRLTVEDHGSGIPEDIRERLFDPFFTTKPRDKGTGLGLAVSYGIVKDHGGELSFESEIGQWTRFNMDLPLDG